MMFPGFQHILVDAGSFPTALSESLLSMHGKGHEGQDFPCLEMWGTLILRHQKSSSLKRHDLGEGRQLFKFC